MANYDGLKGAIQNNYEWDNGQNKIIGPDVEQCLLALIDSLGVGFQYMGVATPSTDPGTPDQRVFYVASTPGTYPNFNNLSLGQFEVALFVYGDGWEKQATEIPSKTQVLNRLDAQDSNIAQFEAAVRNMVENYPNITIVGDVVNAPDQEDITTDENNLLKFANRPAVNGMGYIILRKNKTFAEQVTQQNTIYEIRYDFDLGGAEVTIPHNCILLFDGGSLDNGTIKGNNTKIVWGNAKIFGSQIILEDSFVNDLSPLMFGLGVEANDYAVLKKTHENANNIHRNVSYVGIKEINIDVENGMTSISLGNHTDFCNCKFNVTNNSDEIFTLFSLYNHNTLTPIEISKSQIDSGNFSSVENFPSEPCLLVIQDSTAWLPERIGYSEGPFYRKDIILCIDKEGKNKPIYPYNTANTVPTVNYIITDLTEKVFKNIVLNRKSGIQRTFLLAAHELFNLCIKNVVVNTENSNNLSVDYLFHLYNCANVKCTDINIDNTYSTGGYGYGIYLGNVYNFEGDRIICKATWGCFGAHCLNVATLKNSDCKRFDCHCYGRDFTITGCNNIYVQTEGMYGYCKFVDCSLASPVVIPASGYACTPFDIIIKNCTAFNKGDLAVAYAAIYTRDPEQPLRSEIDENKLPNIDIDGIECEHLYFYYDYAAMSVSNYLNSPILKLSNKTKEGYAFLSANRKINFSMPTPVVIENCYRVYFYQQITETTDYIKENVGSVLYVNCEVVSDPYGVRFAQLKSAGIKHIFDNCRITGMTYPRSADNTYNLVFRNCIIMFAENESSYYLWTAEYDNCVFNFAANKKIIPSDGLFIRNCWNKAGEVESFLNLGVMGAINLRGIKYPIAQLTKLVVFDSNSVAPTLSANLRAEGYSVAENSRCWWDGTNWVDATGTPIS